MTAVPKKPTYGELEKQVRKLKKTERSLLKVEEQLSDETARWRLLLEQSSDGIVILDLSGGVFEANKRFADMLGYTMEEASKIHVWDWDAAYTKEQILEMLQTVDDSGSHFETRHRRKDGRVIDVELSTNGSVYQGEKLIFCICRDITERKKAEDSLRESEKKYRELSIVDGLTQLYNSRHFHNQLKMEVDRVNRYGQPLTLMLLDLDDFKRFNDTYGHVEGDQVLWRLGQVIKRCLRQTDSGYRYGGEEFTLLLPMTTCANGTITAERLRSEFKKEIFTPLSGVGVHMTLSVGVGQYKQDEELNDFVHRVDQLMYRVKKSGKDRVCAEA